MNNISFGLHSCLAAIQQRPFHIQEVLLIDTRKDNRILEIRNAADKYNVVHRLIDKAAIEKICGDVNHQGALVIYKQQQTNSEASLLEFCAGATQPLLLLVLDQIVDPHNLGACLRTAEAAGVSAVISSTRNSAPLTPTVRKVACGAAERVPLIYAKNLARFLDELKQLGIWVYGTTPKAQRLIYQADFSRSVALVVGAEGAGMRRLVTDKCDQLFSLPMAGEMASLNASVATGVGLFEAVRQRHEEQ